ncbi:MAG: hypothetical protein U0Q11_22115 [Vicinamibacterales bacterium]
MRLILLAVTLFSTSLVSAAYAAETNKTTAPPNPPPAAATAAAPAPAPAAPAAAAAPTQPGVGPYSYSAAGRRDPFQTLAGPVAAETKSLPKTAVVGIGGIRVEDLSVRGIMQSRDRLVAMIQGPDSRTYLIHQGDKLADGAVKSITPQGLVLLQDIVDPRAKDKTREVHKALRSSEDEKE